VALGLAITRRCRFFDLAAEWRKFTGLPFVFALWVAMRRKARALSPDFEDSRTYGLAHVKRSPRICAKLNLPRGGEDVLDGDINYSLTKRTARG